MRILPQEIKGKALHYKYGGIPLFLLFFLLMACRTLDKKELGKKATVINSLPGQRLPGNWRPFSDDSPWNTPIPTTARAHNQSEAIINKMSAAAKTIRFGNYFIIPLWVVNADNMPGFPAQAAYPFDIWDYNNDLLTDVKVPIDTTMWGEQTEDGHIIIIDTTYNFAWEMSRFKGIKNGKINCSTFNIWDLTGNGVGNPDEGKRWKARGGRGSGFPNIAGLVRPEEIKAGEINHALAFTFSTNKKDDFYYPAARTDGRHEVADVPAEGMRFQLNPELTEADFNKWGLSAAAKVVARALQQYGMFLCDNGGAMALQLQLLDKNTEENRKRWDALAPGLYSSVSKIPTGQFRIINTGEAITGGKANVVTTPLITPQYGNFKRAVEVEIIVNQNWPDAEIRYTLDGSTPTAGALLYQKPFLLKSSATVKARAFHPNGKESAVMRAPIVIKK